MRSKLLGAIVLLLCPAVAAARDYCPDRPGIDTPPCTVDAGQLSLETSLGDWAHDGSAAGVTDTLLLGDVMLRYGVDDRTELRAGWTAFGHVRSRTMPGQAVTRSSGTGDVTIGIKRNLIDPDGKDLSIALLPSASLPTGGKAIGAGDWSAGLQVPVNVPLGGAVALLLTPEVDAAANASGNGRHLAYGSAAGLAFAPLRNLNIAIEGSAIRDDDPGGATTELIVGMAAGLMLGDAVQVDVGSEFGVSRGATDRRLYLGFARRF